MNRMWEELYYFYTFLLIWVRYLLILLIATPILAVTITITIFIISCTRGTDVANKVVIAMREALK